MRLVFQPKKFQTEFKTQFKNLSPRIKIFSKNNCGAERSEIEVFWGRFDFVSKPLAIAFIYFIYKRYFIGLAAPFFFVCANDLLMYLSRISFFATFP